jgi:uncharacterized membrane protein
MYPEYVFFIIMTLVYFFAPVVGKKEPNLENLNEYANLNINNLILFVLIVILSQCVLNTLELTRKCKGTFFANMKRGFGLTFIPWIFVFGATVFMIYLFPMLKSMFSNVIGYLFVSGMAYDFFNRVIGDSITIKPDILNNVSSVLNEMTPETFTNVVEKMTPIMTQSEEGDMQELLSIVVLKDNIGEMCWYLFAGTLAVLISFHALEKKGCVENVQYIRDLQNRIHEQKKKQTNK